MQDNTRPAPPQGPIAFVLDRFPDAKKTTRGWQARCPAHPDRGPSLSIAEGRDGRALLRCFAGCEAVAIVHALGLEMRDLFPPRAADELPRRSDGPVSPRAVDAAVAAETARIRGERGIAPFERLLVAERREMRRRVTIRLGVTFPTLAPSVFDGGTAYERDALWPAVLEHEFQRVWIEWNGEPAPFSEDAPMYRVGVATLIEAQDRAAHEMRRIYRAALDDR